MRHIIVRRTINSPDMNDAKGAFMPESKALAKLLRARGDAVGIHSLTGRAGRNVVAKAHFQIGTLSVFCHGWRKGVEALPRGREGAKKTARWMKEAGCEFLNMFTCNAAFHNPKGCFAQWVAEACHDLGHVAQVYGHESAGHTTWNPKIRFWWSTRQGVATDSMFDSERDPWSERTAFRLRLKEDQEYRLLLPFIFDEDEN